MGIGELLLIACSLSMDAFAAAVCHGLAGGKITLGGACTAGLWFGGFQALMPLCGWFLGAQLAGYIEAASHWVALALLSLIGGNMIWEALQKEKKPEATHGNMLLPALATSIDALAMGVAFSMAAGDTLNIWAAALVIGLVAFIFSVAGVLAGSCRGARFLRGAKIAGGAILILIGVHIVLEHLHIIG